MTEASWTLDELTERVGAALSVGYDGQPSGRVRDLPDRRAIRWYTTIGLVDRPAAMRGRTAMYGPRHLLQLVAIKRLQAQGRSLVAIQAELAGATDARLARVAQVAAAEELPAALGEGAAPAGLPAATPAPGHGLVRQARFWRERPVETVGTAAFPPVGDAAGVATLRGVRLGERATLLLDLARPLDDADLRAILDAAHPLLEALRARGLDERQGGHDPGREHS
ncbi:MAG TPA: MerR family transcriptional regulator [Actinomycetota bacterium]|nr:MerR family transcriptional regulator [Actinomycetota bacterium]